MSDVWQDVCSIEDLVTDSGVCSLINGKQVALFSVKNEDGEHIYALQNYDPFGKANVLYRGLLGSSEEQIFVASPLYKQRFCLSTGQCLDEDSVSIATFAAKVLDGRVLVKTTSIS